MKLRLLAIVHLVMCTALGGSTNFNATPTVTDWAHITTTPIKALFAPSTLDELRLIIRYAAQSRQKIAILGAGYSQGGQTAYKNGIVIDMKHLRSIINLDVANKKITVQAGIKWHEIQHFIDPRNLSIIVMQSYYNFSVGGSLSVNAHGRHNLHGQLIETVESIKIMLADGSLVTANRQENYDLFRAAIGGYGFMGVIVEATIRLTDNIPLERNVTSVALSEYKEFFFKHIHGNPAIIIQNGNLYPDDFDTVLSIAWHTTQKPLTMEHGIQEPEKFYPGQLIGQQIFRRVPLLKKVRAKLEPFMLDRPAIGMRNMIIADDTQALKPLFTYPTSHILQEYFIPCDHFEQFVYALRTATKKYRINMLNCSIRYVPKNHESFLSYALHDSFALVLYINVLNTEDGKEYTKEWTRVLTQAALDCKGSYYLPYLVNARKDQFLRAFPQFNDFIAAKEKYDPQHVFSNELFRHYLPQF